MSTFAISSRAFKPAGRIPEKYTCDGEDMSPPLSISSVPVDARSLALVVDDPDAPAGTWVHWVVWNIPPTAKEIPENSLPPGTEQGLNDFRRREYGGPCPPSGTHRYFFKVYALDAALDLKTGSNKTALEHAMKGHILAQAELVGLYRRS
jgi:Raf kinase inhibitor-like YbhB/YbcL family protein